ncbi:sulfatase-like hydrolase/transferase [Pleomorphovibrio marinus]|uniref:sulfatase-like hydrolase/transferase n=1 Tax=Pleomorphovibrio marinus TaxID=2164132 RepID=UPI0018E5904B|nr:sulfatase-like hydrolase/transferase [Pleomorphovibrio marinus]
MKILKRIVILNFIFLPMAAFLAEVNALEDRPPNIIFVLTDDLGYGDLGVLFQNQRKVEGKPYHSTPHLDQFASEGMRLNRHYVPAPVCAPSRASLLRGVHQGHAEIRNNQFDKALPDNHTLASVLKQAGYATALIGKYGLQGLEGDSPETWEAYPTKRGFDYFFGYVRHTDGHNHYPAHEAPARPPVELYDGVKEISKDLEGCYTTDLFTARAKQYIIDHQKNSKDQPFFLYLAHDTPHAGLQVAAKSYPEGMGVDGGMQWIGKPGQYINTADGEVDTYIHPEYAEKDWPEVHKRFASMVRRIDDSMADIVQLLKDLEIEDNTMVVFTSDNGPHHESYGYGDYAPTLFESFGVMDGTKRDTWEGGIRVPTLVRWPGVIPADSRSDTPTAFHDWLATFADLSGLPAPANTDGVSMLPLLKGEKSPFGGKVYIEYTVGGATPDYPSFDPSHKGQTRGEMQVLYLHGYKGIRYDIQSHTDDFRIYDTQNDPKETKDLAGTSEEFDKLQAEMKRRVIQWRRPNGEAQRLYDEEPLAAIDYEVKLKEGVMFRHFKRALAYAPDVNTIKEAPDEVKALPTIQFRESDNGGFVNVYEGYFEVSQTGSYSFTLSSDGSAVMHIHDAMLFDADKGYKSGEKVKATIQLEKGRHPFHLVYAQHSGPSPSLEINWQSESMSETSFLESRLFYPDFSN